MESAEDYLVNLCKHFKDKKCQLYVTSSNKYTFMLFISVEMPALQLKLKKVKGRAAGLISINCTPLLCIYSRLRFVYSSVC